MKQTLVGITDKNYFENFGSDLLLKYVKIQEISVFHREICNKISIHKTLELKTNIGNLYWIIYFISISFTDPLKD